MTTVTRQTTAAALAVQLERLYRLPCSAKSVSGSVGYAPTFSIWLRSAPDNDPIIFEARQAAESGWYEVHAYATYRTTARGLLRKKPVGFAFYLAAPWSTEG